MTVWERIQGMDREGLGKLLFIVYNKGWFDGHQGVDDEGIFSAALMDMDASVLEKLQEEGGKIYKEAPHER